MRLKLTKDQPAEILSDGGKVPGFSDEIETEQLDLLPPQFFWVARCQGSRMRLKLRDDEDTDDYVYCGKVPGFSDEIETQKTFC